MPPRALLGVALDPDPLHLPQLEAVSAIGNPPPMFLPSEFTSFMGLAADG